MQEVTWVEKICKRMERKDQYQADIKMYAHAVHFHDKKIYNHDSFLYETSKMNALIMFVLILSFKRFKFNARLFVFLNKVNHRFHTSEA